MTIDRDPRDKAVAEALRYSIYHYRKGMTEESCYYQLWNPVGNPVFNDAAHGAAYFLPEMRTEAEAWALCPRFTDSMDACREVLDFVYRQPKERIVDFKSALSKAASDVFQDLPQSEIAHFDAIVDALLFRLQPTHVVDAFLVCHAVEPWPPLPDIVFGDFDDA
jgi:hypothetical protein